MMSSHAFTWSACQFVHCDLQADRKDKVFLTVIAGIIDSLKHLSNPQGKAHLMLPVSPPSVLLEQIVACVDNYVREKKRNSNWEGLLPYCMDLIGKHCLTFGCCDAWSLMVMPWWGLGLADLNTTHKTLLSRELWKAEEANRLLEQPLKEERVNKVPPPVIVTVASSTDLPPSLKDTVSMLSPEGSNLDSLDYSHRSDSVFTLALMVVIEGDDGAYDLPVINVPDTPIPEEAHDDPKGNNPGPKGKDPITNTMSIKYIGNTYKGDPMENLNFPYKSPPKGESHFAGHCVETWDKSGNYIGKSWVRCRRKLLGKLPDN
jgi:hypothetical protein